MLYAFEQVVSMEGRDYGRSSGHRMREKVSPSVHSMFPLTGYTALLFQSTGIKTRS